MSTLPTVLSICTKARLKVFVAVLLLVVVISSCTRSKTTVNNYPTPNGNTTPAFVISGITDITFTNDINTYSKTYLSVEYRDSLQENVVLTVSGLPAGVETDTTWVHSGIPTYNTALSLYDTAIAGGAAAGDYPITITATTTSGKQKFYTFHLRILPVPWETFTGTYANSFLYCISGSAGPYTDSVYTDPTVVNKLWFANFANAGTPVYGMLTGTGGGLIIPAQTVGGVTYKGGGTVSTAHQINISFSSNCAMNMWQ